MRVLRILGILSALLVFGGSVRAQEAVEIKVMTFNIWYGGVQVDFHGVVDAIRAAKADVVGMQEPEGNLRAIADALGWSYADESRHIISRFPLYPGERDGIVFDYVAVAPERVIAVANVHLSATPYGPEAVRDGQSAEEVLALEDGLRRAEIEPYVKPLGDLAASGVPVFLTGDFNTPSHFDWTAAMAAARPQVKYPLDWPTSKALADAGFRDSYRDAYPDPVARPGLTWTPGTPPPLVREQETLDRIDMVWSIGPATTLASQLVGETGGPDVDISVEPWPSDHRAVVSTFQATPAAAPALVAVDRRVIRQGERAVLRYLAPDIDEGRYIALLAAGGDAGAVVASLPIYDGSDHRAGMFGTAGLAPGAYEAALIAGDGSIEARTPLWILAPDARPAVEVAAASVAAGAPIVVRWRNAPGNKLDWLGVFAAGDPDVYNYYAFLYAGAVPEGEVTFDEATIGAVLEPGEYEARLFLDDGYSELARVTFTVTAP